MMGLSCLLPTRYPNTPCIISMLFFFPNSSGLPAAQDSRSAVFSSICFFKRLMGVSNCSRIEVNSVSIAMVMELRSSVSVAISPSTSSALARLLISGDVILTRLVSGIGFYVWG